MCARTETVRTISMTVRTVRCGNAGSPNDRRKVA
jgi:hypothetical protein